MVSRLLKVHTQEVPASGGYSPLLQYVPVSAGVIASANNSLCGYDGVVLCFWKIGKSITGSRLLTVPTAVNTDPMKRRNHLVFVVHFSEWVKYKESIAMGWSLLWAVGP